MLVVAAVDPAAGTPADRDCLVAGAEQASGFSNTAALATNGTTVEDSSCVEIPPSDPDPDLSLIDVTKDFAGPATAHDDGTSTVAYRLTVTNRGDAKATYDLNDRLRVGAGLTVRSASAANTAPGAIQTNDAWNGTTNPGIVVSQAIEPGTTHSYAVTLRVATGPVVSASDVDCMLALGQVDTGVRNTAAAVADGVEHTAAACPPVRVGTSAVVLPGPVSQPLEGRVLPATGAGGVARDLFRVGLILIIAGVAMTRLSGRVWRALPGR